MIRDESGKLIGWIMLVEHTNDKGCIGLEFPKNIRLDREEVDMNKTGEVIP